jgi:hypothetical protein
MRFRLFIIATAAVILFPFHAASQDENPLIVQAMGRVDPSWIQSDALILTGEEPYESKLISSRSIHNEAHQSAVEFLSERLRQDGPDLIVEEFDCGTSENCRNLFVEIRGETSPDKIWIVGAHYDSTNGYDDDEIAPGAVDNASGVIVVLQALAALRPYRFADTIRFILFDAEEEGLLGSSYHAANASDLGEDVRLIYNLDIPAWRFPGINFAFANSDYPSWPDLKLLNRLSEDYSYGTEMIGIPAPGLDSSNMAPFWYNGYHGFIVGSLYALTPWMNTQYDTYEKFDQEQCANISRATTAYLAERAGILGPVDDDATDDAQDDSSDDWHDDTVGQTDDTDISADDAQAGDLPAGSGDDDNDASCGC